MWPLIYIYVYVYVFSYMCVCVCVCVCACANSLQSCPTFFLVMLWTMARQAPLSIEFSRQECWSELSCPLPGDLPNPKIEPTSLMSPALAGGFFTTSTTWNFICRIFSNWTHQILLVIFIFFFCGFWVWINLGKSIPFPNSELQKNYPCLFQYFHGFIYF